MVVPTEPDTFDALLQGAREGDADALNGLGVRYYERVRRLVHARLAADFRRDRPWLSARFSTQDIVQEAFGEVLLGLDAFRGSTEASFLAYLTMVVRNRILGRIRYHEQARRDGRRAAGLGAEAHGVAEGQDPAEEATQSELLGRVASRVADLPERERLLFEARTEETASFRELAEMLGYGSESAARRAYFRLQAQLLVDLSHDDRGEM